MPLLIVLGLAGGLTQAAPVSTPQLGAISGQVLEGGTLAPIAGAQVTLLPSGPRPVPEPFSDQLRTAVTDQSGRFRFEGVEPGRYGMGVHKTGFADPIGPGLPEIDLGPGERRDAGAVMLQKGGVISGRVLDEAGEPLVSAGVMLMRRPKVPPGATLTRQDLLVPGGSSAQTNDIGEFRLFGLPPGEYYLQAFVHSEFGGAAAPRARTMFPTYFPDTSDPAAAQPVSVAAGQTASDVVIRMVGAPAFQVSGVVRDEAGTPVAHALVRLDGDDPSGGPAMFMTHRQSRTDATGHFAINNVTNGAYTLLAIAPVLISRQDSAAGASMIWGSVSGSGVRGGAVMTETRNGTTVQYRDDLATRVPITVNDGNVEGLEVVVWPPRS
jgi:protocatechuate 3,4-dioxygenase beta subunit